MVAPTALSVPMLAVVSSSTFPSFMAATARAAVVMALIPSRGRLPAWEALPVITARTTAWPGAEMTMRPGGPLESSTRALPVSRRERSFSRAFAPYCPLSSPTVKISWTVRWGTGWSFKDRASSTMAATPHLSSPPRMVGPLLRRTPSCPRTGSIPFPGDTVSRCAERIRGGRPSLPFRVHSRFQPLEWVSCAFPCRITSAPRAFRSCSTFRHISLSSPDSLSILTYSMNVSSNRFRLTICIPLSYSISETPGPSGRPKAIHNARRMVHPMRKIRLYGSMVATRVPIPALSS